MFNSSDEIQPGIFVDLTAQAACQEVGGGSAMTQRWTVDNR
jgi:hypothetical protein